MTTTNSKESLTRMTFEVPQELHKQYKHMAASHETTMKKMLIEAMRNQVSQQKIK